MSEPRKLNQKLKVWFCEYWNVSDFLAVLLFLAGLALRCHGDPYRTAGRISYCLDLIFWFVRVMDLLAVNQHAGPYLTIITKMVGVARGAARPSSRGVGGPLTCVCPSDPQHVLHRGDDGHRAAELRRVPPGHPVPRLGAVLEPGPGRGLPALLDDLRGGVRLRDGR